MNRVKLVIMFSILALIGCKSPIKQNEQIMEHPEQISDKLEPKVTGIGGIFFFADNPEETKNWYKKNLGIETNDHGAVFEFRNTNQPDEINYLIWSPFEKGSDYFVPSKKEFMINYRVQNIEALVERLKINGVEILNEIETYEYGKFVHILDLEGNKIELWEPIDSILTEIGDKTNK